LPIWRYRKRSHFKFRARSEIHAGGEQCFAGPLVFAFLHEAQREGERL
jgi:hypothetical protein